MRVRVAAIRSAVGLKGEVRLQNFSDIPETRYVENAVFLTENLEHKVLTLQKIRTQSTSYIAKFTEVNDRNVAESLRDTELFVEIDRSDGVDNENGSENDDEFYYAEIIGLQVYHSSRCDANLLGKVSNVISNGAQDLLEIELVAGNKTLVPFVKKIVPIVNIQDKFLVIAPPGGLLDETY